MIQLEVIYEKNTATQTIENNRTVLGENRRTFHWPKISQKKATD